MSRKILLPADLDRRLQDLTALEEEVRGSLLCRYEGEHYLVDSLFVTGVGTSAAFVKPIRKRIEIVNAFLNRNPDYSVVEFHTHSIGTIRGLGQYWATNFSRQDIGTITENLRANKNYIHMLATPVTRILYGNDNPTLQIVNGFPNYATRSQAIGVALRKIATSLGYTFENLPANLRI